MQRDQQQSGASESEQKRLSAIADELAALEVKSAELGKAWEAVKGQTAEVVHLSYHTGACFVCKTLGFDIAENELREVRSSGFESRPNGTRPDLRANEPDRKLVK